MNELQFDEFLRSVAISKNDTFALLLGAGSSISSGISSANDCIWDWKATIYKSNNYSATGWIENFKNPKVQRTIQAWLDNQGGYVEAGSKEEYSFYAKKCFPIEKNRSQYFQALCSNAKPSIGYRTIPLLVKHGMLDSVWTTNFDELVTTSCILGGVQSIEISLDTVDRINQRTQNRSELPVIKLHGDFKYGELKNTAEELKEQDQTFRQKLIEYLGDKHLIVLGYSGRDLSLMDTLKEAYSKKGGGMLFWCGYHENSSSEVTELIHHANQNKRLAYYIPTEGFDNTMVSITKLVLAGESKLKQELISIQQSNSSNDSFSPFDLKPARTNKVLKSNCFPIKFPEEVFVFDATLNENPWDKLNSLSLTRTDISAIPYEKKVWALGTLESVKEALISVISGDIVRKPLTDTRIYNSGINSLMLSTICKIFASAISVKTNFRDKVWGDEYQNIANQKVFHALRFALEKVNGEFYLTLNPSFVLENEDVDSSIRQQIGMTFYHKIWNNHFNDYVKKWSKKLFVNDNDKYEFPIKSGSGFSFIIARAPIFTNICDLNNPYSNAHNVPQKFLRLRGVQFKEAALLFSTKHGNNHISDTHPMRGLINNKPYETSLNTFLDTTIYLGVICPEQDSKVLFEFLSKQNQEIPKFSEKDDYILDFKGFHRTYGLSLNIPEPSSSNWENVSEPRSNDFRENIHEVKRNICDKIMRLTATGSQKVIIIYIPQRWDYFTSYHDNGESYDLHDYVKAFCVEKRVTSQFIREKTINDVRQSCQINWWLSLSYFVKSLRTPWILNNTDKSTAFAGIGYSIDSKSEEKGHIVLGCSHIYSSTGEGLKYKLSKISNDKIQWRHKKPHLGYDDAYEFGKSVINLFYESLNEIPKRVVIHKRTFFTEEEKNGILDSLYDSASIEAVDLVEINFEDDIRYVSSKIKNGRTEIDGFSVSRGTCIQINASQALLWAHGVVPSVNNPKFSFYPGGRYIPKPLKVIKHHGTGSLEQIANEILGLTKMNWNSLNMYSQLPATISSSNDIARIGKLIESKEKVEYDYRYFI
ncbi:SIR2 family protein [Desertivirga arenae]|uniref:SIR2 family protein n=1 Tax=Desertivirga arenae TaxID=2810309 RepID=UPI001A97C8E6|nr:SIR2 family protein [Pedobacter sp. SYSU D00823]